MSGYFGPPIKGHVIQRMRNPKVIAMIHYVQPKKRHMMLQVSLKLQTNQHEISGQ